MNATKTNYNIQVIFQTKGDYADVDAVSSDPDTAKQFHMINQLNRAGLLDRFAAIGRT